MSRAHHQSDAPLVTIGVPVYNGEAYLATALDSLLQQDYPRLEIIIRDNASTDQTSSICRAVAARDPRIRYLRNAENIGPLKNYCRLVEDASGDYFMWAADDDLHNSGFVEALIQSLQAEPHAVLATPQTVPIDSSEKPLPLAVQPAAQAGSRMENVRRFFNPENPGWACDGWFYGLFRHAWLLKHARDQLAYRPWGGDLLWLFSILTAQDITGNEKAELRKRVLPSSFQPTTWLQTSLFRHEMRVGFTRLCWQSDVTWHDKVRLQQMAWSWYSQSFFQRDRRVKTWLRGTRLTVLDALLSCYFPLRRLI